MTSEDSAAVESGGTLPEPPVEEAAVEPTTDPGIEGEPEEEGGSAEPEPEEEEVPGEEVASPGSPVPAAQQSRAGEQVETRDRITPGQAVDLPWDL